VCGQILRLALQRLFEQCQGPIVSVQIDLRQGCPTSIGERVGVEILRQPRALDGEHFELQLAGEPAHDLVPDALTIGSAALDPTAPDRQPGRRIDQFDIDPQCIVLQPHAAVQCISDLKFGPEPGDVDRLGLVAARGLARDDPE